jgi:hypothetical protein
MQLTNKTRLWDRLTRCPFLGARRLLDAKEED